MERFFWQKRKGGDLNGLQETDWSYDLCPCYEGVGVEELFSFTTRPGGGVSRTSGGSSHTGLTNIGLGKSKLHQLQEHSHKLFKPI